MWGPYYGYVQLEILKAKLNYKKTFQIITRPP